MVSATPAAGHSSHRYTPPSQAAIDVEALVEADVNARMQAARTLEHKVRANTAHMQAYTKFKTLLDAMENAAAALRNSQAESDADTNVFKARAVYLNASDGSTATDHMEATAKSGTQTGTHDITIKQVATAHRIAGKGVNPSTACGKNGAISLGLEGGGKADIKITSTMKLADIARAINDKTETTHVKATIVKVSESESRLVLTAQDSAKKIETSVKAGDDVMQDLGVTNTSGGFCTELRKPQDAKLVVDGMEITRHTNQIDDIIDGVTLKLHSAAPGTTLTLDIAADGNKVQKAVEDLVKAYNAFRDFARENQKAKADGTAAAGSVLFGDSLLRFAGTDISSLLSAGHGDGSLRGIGIKLDKDNHLTVDADTLQDAVANHPQKIFDLFAAQFWSDSPDLRVVRPPKRLGDKDVTLKVTVKSGGGIDSVSVNGDTSLFTVDGTRIKGAKGTRYEGMTLVYTGHTTQSIKVSFRQGIADSLYNTTDSYISGQGGQLTDKMLSLEEQNNHYRDHIDDITRRAEAYRETLAKKYVAMKKNYFAAQSTIEMLRAYLKNSSN